MKMTLFYPGVTVEAEGSPEKLAELLRAIEARSVQVKVDQPPWTDGDTAAAIAELTDRSGRKRGKR